MASTEFVFIPLIDRSWPPIVISNFGHLMVVSPPMASQAALRNAPSCRSSEVTPFIYHKLWNFRSIRSAFFLYLRSHWMLTTSLPGTCHCPFYRRESRFQAVKDHVHFTQQAHGIAQYNPPRSSLTTLSPPPHEARLIVTSNHWQVCRRYYCLCEKVRVAGEWAKEIEVGRWKNTSFSETPFLHWWGNTSKIWYCYT